MNQVREVYEVASPSFNDLNLDQQITFGINDWLAVDKHGREFFGRTRDEAIIACRSYQ